MKVSGELDLSGVDGRCRCGVAALDVGGAVEGRVRGATTATTAKITIHDGVEKTLVHPTDVVGVDVVEYDGIRVSNAAAFVGCRYR